MTALVTLAVLIGVTGVMIAANPRAPVERLAQVPPDEPLPTITPPGTSGLLARNVADNLAAQFVGQLDFCFTSYDARDGSANEQTGRLYADGEERLRLDIWPATDAVDPISCCVTHNAVWLKWQNRHVAHAASLPIDRLPRSGWTGQLAAQAWQTSLWARLLIHGLVHNERSRRIESAQLDGAVLDFVLGAPDDSDSNIQYEVHAEYSYEFDAFVATEIRCGGTIITLSEHQRGPDSKILAGRIHMIPTHPHYLEQEWVLDSPRDFAPDDVSLRCAFDLDRQPDTHVKLLYDSDGNSEPVIIR